jgi:four helix bundle protein
MKKTILQEKSLQLGIKVSIYTMTLKEKRHYEIASQLLRSGTSIGANIHEAIWWQSRRDFCHKYEIALKEWYETLYRCDILEQWFQENIDEIRELTIECVKVLTSSIKTLKIVKEN